MTCTCLTLNSTCYSMHLLRSDFVYVGAIQLYFSRDILIRTCWPYQCCTIRSRSTSWIYACLGAGNRCHVCGFGVHAFHLFWYRSLFEYSVYASFFVVIWQLHFDLYWHRNIDQIKTRHQGQHHGRIKNTPFLHHWISNGAIQSIKYFILAWHLRLSSYLCNKT